MNASLRDLSPAEVAPIDDALLRQARARAAQSGEPLIAALQALSGESERLLLAQLAHRFKWQVIETAQMNEMRPTFELLPLLETMRRNALLLADTAGALHAVICDPLDMELQIWLSNKARSHVQWRLALATDIHACLARQEDLARTVGDAVGSLTDTVESVKSVEVLSLASVEAAHRPAVKLVSSTLYDALKSGVSDIHFESTPHGLNIKYRIDGVLDQAAISNGIELNEQVISRLKVLAGLDIAERRTPQDGSFQVRLNDKDIDLRLSIMPSVHGEDAVVRILDKRAMLGTAGKLTADVLGFDAPSLRRLRDLAQAPHGMLLVTGPTGSGKTTTLYAVLTEMNNGRDKIITIEDPVEYQIPGILQIPVNDKKGLSFARGLRSILRHDPDKIMVGEIRDRETAEIAVQSALTGHLVLSTVHANSVFDVFGRFAHMGLDPYAFTSALNGIWAQRLIRLNCPHCTRAVKAELDLLQSLHINSGEELSNFQAGSGCGDCRGTGYRGRRAIAEFLVLNDSIRELIMQRAPIRLIKDAATAAGTRSLRHGAMDMARRGETTLQEVKRVTHEDA